MHKLIAVEMHLFRRSYNVSQASSIEDKSLLSKARQTYKQKGGLYVLKAGIRRIRATRTAVFLHDSSQVVACKLRWTNRTFVFNEQKLKYFWHRYNLTVRNERAVEIPIVQSFIEHGSSNMLEVGNVLSHYFKQEHDVIDKYEVAKGVVNEDAAYFKTSKRYGLIVCISTLEHIGWDETPKLDEQEEKEKILCTIQNFRQHLTPKGKIVITFPMGYNPYLNELVKSGALGFSRTFFMKRISMDNRWVQTDAEGVKDFRFGDPFPFANGLVVGIIET
jgi:hypothetical protein